MPVQLPPTEKMAPQQLLDHLHDSHGAQREGKAMMGIVRKVENMADGLHETLQNYHERLHARDDAPANHTHPKVMKKRIVRADPPPEPRKITIKRKKKITIKRSK